MSNLFTARLQACGLISVLLLGSSPTHAVQNVIPLDEPLILEMRMDGNLLSDALIAFPENGRLMLPMGALLNALDLPISVYPMRGLAEGWFIREHRSFSLDLDSLTATIEGEPSTFEAQQIKQQADDLYVDSALLERWFPLRFETKLNSMRLRVIAEETLPITERLARQGTRRKVSARDGAGRQVTFIDNPYAAFDYPAVELQLRTRHQRIADIESETANYSALAAGDVLWGTGSLFVAGDDEDSLTSTRARYERVTPDGGALGVNRFEAGDVFSQHMPLMAHSRSGRGISVSSFPMNRSGEFDATTLRGEAQPGWDVELYRNGALLAATAVDAEGIYEFLDIPLLFGHNQLRAVLYGPQGQVREVIRRVYAGGIQTRPGETRFRTAIIEQGKRMIATSDRKPTEYDSLRGTVEVEHGINRELALSAAAARLPGNEDAGEKGVDVYRAGVRSAAFGAFSKLDVFGDSEGGKAVQIATQMRHNDVNINLQHAGFDQYRGDTGSSVLPGELKSRTELRFNGILGEDWRVPWSLRSEIERNEAGDRAYETKLRASSSVAGVGLSNTLTYEVTSLPGNEAKLSGDLLASTAFGDWRLRTGMDYQLRSTRKLESADATLSWVKHRNIGVDFGVAHYLNTDVTDYSFSFYRKFDSLILSLDLDSGSDGDYAAGASLFTAIGRDPLRKRWFASSERLASRGTLTTQVYLDENANGQRDPGERTLEGAVFNGGTEAVTTDSEGHSLIGGLSPNRERQLTLDTSSLEDPYWLPAFSEVAVIPHPGKVQGLDIPVTVTGEIDGVIHLRRDGELRELSNVQLELLDAGGAVAATTRSAFDGFYLFDGVPPGDYQLRVAPEQLKRLDLAGDSLRQISLRGGDVHSGANIELRAQHEQPALVTLAEAPAQPSCTVYGPLLDKRTVAEVYRHARDHDSDPLIRTARHEGAIFYALYLPPRSDAQQTRTTLAALDSAGLENHLMTGGPYRQHIALGYFRHRVYGRARLEQLHAAGYSEARMVKRPRRQTSWWIRTISADTATARELNRTLSSLELGIQHRGCRAVEQ